MEAKVNAEIKRLEERMIELRKLMGILYSMEMHEIAAQLRELHKLKRKD